MAILGRLSPPASIDSGRGDTATAFANERPRSSDTDAKICELSTQTARSRPLRSNVTVGVVDAFVGPRRAPRVGIAGAGAVTTVCACCADGAAPPATINQIMAAVAVVIQRQLIGWRAAARGTSSGPR